MPRTWAVGVLDSFPPVPDPTLADVQGAADQRGIFLERAGVADLRLPSKFTDADGQSQSTVLTASAWVAVPENARGAHMSRLAQAIGELRQGLSLDMLNGWLEQLSKTMQAGTAGVELEFPLFLERPAPSSGVASWLDYSAKIGAQRAAGATETTAKVTVPVKMLCPCSKEISASGAHTQRAHLHVKVWPKKDAACLRQLAEQAESHASAPLQSVLKRVDEKEVTEGAYAKPRFAEDAVREVAADLAKEGQWLRWEVRIVNYESIHNHQVFAQARSPRK